MHFEATATAEAIALQATATAEAIAIEATATASAHQAHREAAESAAAIRQAELATRREELIYPLKAYGPWALVVLLAGLFAFAAIRFIKAAEVRARAIRRDARGDAPLLAFPNGRGGMLVYDPDRSFGPVAVLDGEVSMPSLVDEDQQAAVTMRDQAVDLATRGVASPPRKRSQGTRRRQAQRLAMTGAPPRVQVIPPTKVAAWLQDVRPKALAMTIENPQRFERGEMMNRGTMLQAERAARVIPTTMSKRGVRPLFTDWLLTESDGCAWLFGVLDVGKLKKLEDYTRPHLLHHLSTALQGMPVFLSNSNGLRYAVLLNDPPKLPGKIDFPGVERGQVRLGRRAGGGEVRLPWDRLGHVLAAGMTGAGKSSFLRLLVYQALGDGAALLLADRDDVTFPMLADHPALMAPIAQTRTRCALSSNAA